MEDSHPQPAPVLTAECVLRAEPNEMLSRNTPKVSNLSHPLSPEESRAIAVVA